MGVSTDALLVYGYVWNDEAELPEGSDDDEWEEVVARQRGVPNPWDGHPGDHAPQWVEQHRGELDAWCAAKKAIGEEYGVEISQHGSDSWSCPVVKIAKAGHRAYRGDVHPVAAEDLAVDPAWDGMLERFVTDLGIDASEAAGPGWFLLSWRG
jgi:hypothetical protein